MANLREYIIREHIIFDDPKSPRTSPYDIIWPISVLDAIIDQNTPERITLRQILDDLLRRWDEGREDIRVEFPVTSLRGSHQAFEDRMMGDIVIKKEYLGLGNVSDLKPEDYPVSLAQMNYIKNYVNGAVSHFITANDLQKVEAHFTDYSNPHRTNFAQVNSTGDATALIASMIYTHDESALSHAGHMNRIKLLEKDMQLMKNEWELAKVKMELIPVLDEKLHKLQIKVDTNLDEIWILLRLVDEAVTWETV